MKAKMNGEYKVRAVRRPGELSVSRHGIHFSRSTEVVATHTFQFPDTPYYLAAEMVADEHPGCEIEVIA